MTLAISALVWVLGGCVVFGYGIGQDRHGMPSDDIWWAATLWPVVVLMYAIAAPFFAVGWVGYVIGKRKRPT